MMSTCVWARYVAATEGGDDERNTGWTAVSIDPAAVRARLSSSKPRALTGRVATAKSIQRAEAARETPSSW